MEPITSRPELDTEFEKVWQPGSTVFSARTLDGSEVLLWLIPRIDLPSFCSESASSHPTREVRFTTMASVSSQPAPSHTDLVPTWWVFESVCPTSGCGCGPRSLQEVLAILPRRAAGQALAAHVDFAEALNLKLISPRTPHASELSFAAARLFTDLNSARLASHRSAPQLLAS